MTSHSILVAEDEEDVREVIVRVLELSGYEVVGVADGEDAVQTALDILPDLILLDVRMPKMTGYEACEALKAETVTQHIPIVFLTAKGKPLRWISALNWAQSSI